MANDDYTSAIGGGLKLKGAKPSGVKKKKRPKASASASASASAIAAAATSTSTEAPASALTRTEAERELQALEAEISAAEKAGDGTANSDAVEGESYKTPTERRHEEMRRKRLEERLKREGGVKTHKQRVEELNRYLSGLSEHHDMYVFVVLFVVGREGGGGEGVQRREEIANVVFLQAQNRTWITGLGISCTDMYVLFGMGILGSYMESVDRCNGRLRDNHEGKAKQILHKYDGLQDWCSMYFILGVHAGLLSHPSPLRSCP